MLPFLPVYLYHLSSVIEHAACRPFLYRLPDRFRLHDHRARKRVYAVCKQAGRKGSAGTDQKNVRVKAQPWLSLSGVIAGQRLGHRLRMQFFWCWKHKRIIELPSTTSSVHKKKPWSIILLKISQCHKPLPIITINQNQRRWRKQSFPVLILRQAMSFLTYEQVAIRWSMFDSRIWACELLRLFRSKHQHFNGKSESNCRYYWQLAIICYL